jgi:hypothetical protein
MFFEHGCGRKVIKSSKAGFLQHELYSWEVTYNDMERADEISTSSRILNKTLKDWVAALDNSQREKFANALYSILCASEASSISELEKSWLKAGGKMLKFVSTLDEDSRKMIIKATGELFKAARKHINDLVKQEITARQQKGLKALNLPAK